MDLKTKKEIIQKILDYKNSKNLKELQIARLLRKELSCFAIKWTTSPSKEFVIYEESYKDNDIKREINPCFQTFFEILDILYFIQELEKDGYVKILSIASNKENTNILFDREKYKYSVEHPITFPDNIKFSEDLFYIEGKDRQYLVPIKYKQKINIDIVDLFDNYATKIIYSLPKLEEYLKNNFQTIEEVRYNEQLKRTDKSIRIATKSVYITVISVILTLITTLCTVFRENNNLLKLDVIQFERIEKLIKEENTKQLKNNEVPANKAENQDLNVIRQTGNKK